MPKVILDQTMSLDGFVAGPDDGVAHPLGTRGGAHIFDWYQGGEPMWNDERFAPVGEDRAVVRTMADAYGAFVTGRKTYDITNGWNGTHPMVEHIVVVTHRPPTDVPRGTSTITFATDVPDAVGKAKRLAGEKAVAVGTARMGQQALAAGLVDELWLHIVPLVLGDGLRLLDRLERLPIRLAQTEVIVGPGATHVRYRVERRANA